MKPTRKQNPQMLRSLLAYDAETGELRWRERTPEMFSDGRGRYSREWKAASWNKKNAASVAFTTITGSGYKIGAVHSGLLMAHRVAWAIYYGEWPKSFIDHINGDKTDNCICNLRVVTKTENCRNTPLRSDNKTGTPGVSRLSSGKWHARINVSGQPILIGNFEHLNDAVAARKAAERKYGFHQNHGRREAISPR